VLPAVGAWTLFVALSFQPQVDVAPSRRAADALFDRGDHAAAVRAYRAILKAEGESVAADRAALLDRLGASEIALGEYDLATRDNQSAAALYDRLGDRRRQSNALNRAGLARLYAGDYPAAEVAITAAVRLAEQVHDTAAEAEQESNLGNVYYFVGRYGEAASAYARSLALADAHSGEPWSARRRRLALINQATLDQRLGRDREALSIYQTAAREGAGLPPEEQAQLLVNLGVLYRHLGDSVKAIETYERAAAMFAAGRNLDGELGVAKNRGIALALDLGDLPKARMVFSAALASATTAGNQREMLQAQLYRAETSRRLGEFPSAAADFAASLDLARRLKTPEEEWKSRYGLGRVAAALGHAQEAAAHFDGALAVIEALREQIRVPSLRSDYFSDKREVYDSLIALRLETASAAEVLGLLERSHSRAWRDRLGLSAAIDLPSIQQRLTAGECLLDYWDSEAGAAVVVVTSRSANIVRLDVTDDAVTQLIGRLSGGPSADWRIAADALGRRLLPIQLPGEVMHVLVVPDGALALVPFEVLTVSGQPLVARTAVSYLPTAAMLLQERPAPAMMPPWKATADIFAHPDLASAADEGRWIAGELGGRPRLFAGADDQKSRFMASAERSPILHLASHAVADGDALEQSRILFAPSAPGGPDEFLFLREVYDLHLGGVELAVLSACDTARGRVVRGEGVQSFSRAFLAAGAATTVTTLWRVPDAPTADFMRGFYQHLQRGDTRAEALRAAKLRFATSGGPLADPHYWAAFVLTGEADRPVSRAPQWTTVIVGAAVLVVAGFLMITWRRPARRNLTR
jgi:tetratricopeptide (TPR) repeat protein